jgi:hypothetical protein
MVHHKKCVQQWILSETLHCYLQEINIKADEVQKPQTSI